MVILDRKGKENDIINSVKELFNNVWLVDGTEIKISAPIVCAKFPQDFKTVSQSLELLNYLSDQAKDVRKTNVIYATKENLAELEKERKIEIALNSAIRNKSIEVFYQPIHNAKNQKLCSAEALCRIYDNQLGYIPPNIFINLAEKNGCIVNVGNIIFEKVCKFIAENVKTKKIKLDCIELNISPLQCLFSDFADNFIAIAKKYGVEPKYINLELTEADNLHSEDIISSQMNKLHEYGFSFSCDDYGTGYSTCSYLVKFPFKNVKFDRSLTNGYFNNQQTKIITTHEIKTLKALKYKVIVEGIETQEEYETFKNLGAHYIQGYYFSKPLPENQFIEYCLNHNNTENHNN